MQKNEMLKSIIMDIYDSTILIQLLHATNYVTCK